MEKKALDRLIKEGQRLAEKRTWLKKGFEDLFNKINAELAKIPAMDEDPVVYTLLDKPGNDYDLGAEHYIIKMYFEDDAIIFVRKGVNDGYGWKYEDVDDPTIETIRAFASQLASCLAHFLEVIESRNKTNQKAIDTISDLLKKLA